MVEHKTFWPGVSVSLSTSIWIHSKGELILFSPVFCIEVTPYHHVQVTSVLTSNSVVSWSTNSTRLEFSSIILHVMLG